ncbi:GNAT family N-acetyltransferase [Paenibacillus pinistramenti]|uniref:GNAT family N-acetyltransferase n=1 Tax=Paenibacillus pinistramenti TaxID=1768003 RepID=UPI001108ACEF|nr:GNAT family N-acetyltransferase [Paenibacillus pinistramenti]
MEIEKLFYQSPNFETDRLLLRKLSLADAEDYFRVASNAEVTAQTIWARHTVIEDSINYIQGVLEKYRKREAFHWGIIHKSTGRLIGRTGLIKIDQEHEKAELGYVLSSDYWSQGIITEATKMIIEYGFMELGLNRIEARCNYNNPGSFKVMEKLGMQFEGLLRKQLKIKGQFLDQKLYSILRSDFIACFQDGSQG